MKELAPFGCAVAAASAVTEVVVKVGGAVGAGCCFVTESIEALDIVPPCAPVTVKDHQKRKEKRTTTTRYSKRSACNKKPLSYTNNHIYSFVIEMFPVFRKRSFISTDKASLSLRLEVYG